MATRKKPAPIEETERKSDFAARLGLTRGRISQMVAAGLPVTPEGLVPVERALAWVEANIGTSKADAGDAAALLAARVRLTQAQAELAEIAARKAEGEVIDLADARRLIVSFARIQRDALLQFASREGPGIAGALGTDTRRTVAILDASLRKLAEDIARTRLPFSSKEQK